MITFSDFFFVMELAAMLALMASAGRVGQMVVLGICGLCAILWRTDWAKGKRL